MGRPKESKAQLVETIQTSCPYCFEYLIYSDIGWRDKPQEDGKSFCLTRCQKCRKLFRLNYLK